MGEKIVDRRAFLIGAGAASLVGLQACAAGPGGPRAVGAARPRGAATSPSRLYARSIHFMYPQLLSAQHETFETLTRALDKVDDPRLTFLSPLFLNVTDFTPYRNIIAHVRDRGIGFGCGVGGPGPGNRLMDNNGRNQTALRAIADAGFQPYLRVDNLSGFYGNDGGEDDVKNFLRLAISLGFHNIMLNPWPRMPAGKPNAGSYMKITEADLIPHIDSCFQNASYQDYLLVENDMANIVAQTSRWPQGLLHSLINYESPGPQRRISQMPYAQQVAIFDKTINDIRDHYADKRVHMALPFTGSYNPLKQVDGAGATMWDAYMVPKLRSFT